MEQRGKLFKVKVRHKNLQDDVQCKVVDKIDTSRAIDLQPGASSLLVTKIVA